MPLLEWEPGRFVILEEIFQVPKVKNYHFTNGKLEARILFSCYETSKNGQFVKGNPPFFIPGGIFRCRNVGNNGHFANGKPAVSPEARIRILSLRNVQKFSLTEGETGCFLFR
jgi:hypothetical protein